MMSLKDDTSKKVSTGRNGNRMPMLQVSKNTDTGHR